ncbi:MAG: hypothetical protein M1820_010265 [Bogoriella megaspora]|nr:MAG: hypothetical protein M1820_010265 [Bogoriella megaspora]
MEKQVEDVHLEDAEEDAFDEAEGLPSLTDPFMQKYLEGRDALVAQEKKQRSDHAFRETLSPMAAEASAIVSQIRFEEQQTVWTDSFEDELAHADVDYYPGMMFTHAKNRMEKTKLWKIVRRMPKGALLHCHYEAVVETEWLIDQALETPGLHIEAATALTAENLSKTAFLFSYAESSPAIASSIWSEAYEPDAQVSVQEAAKSYPNGGVEGFRKWLRSRFTFKSDNHHESAASLWKRFSGVFLSISTLVCYEPILRKSIQHTLKQLMSDGVRYVDMRKAMLVPLRREKSVTVDIDQEGLVAVMDEEIERFKRSAEGNGFWGARLIWTTLRIFDKRQIVESKCRHLAALEVKLRLDTDMKECIRLKQIFPELIAGFDLVGQEDAGRPLVDMLPELFWFKKRCMEEQVDIPFFFHAGETCGDGDMTDENLFDAILLGTRRIGHGLSLYKHPLLIDMVKEKRILVESCPVSNEVLRFTGPIKQHPLPALLSRGVPVALCNDDPAVMDFGASGMTHDYWQALQGWENLGLEGLGSLAETSVRYAAFEDCSAKEWAADVKAGSTGSGIRAKRLKEWARDWEKFCQWVVLEFGADMDLEQVD